MMYHEFKDVSLIKGCIMTPPMYHDFTINRLWSSSHIHTFFFLSSCYKREETLKEFKDLCIQHLEDQSPTLKL